MIYLREFETTAAYEAAEDTLELPNVSLIDETMSTVFKPYVPTQPNNVITYTASAKLSETTSSSSAGLHTNVFSGSSGQLTITSHTFENGVGTINFDSDVVTVGDRAFFQCGGMTSISIPNSVTYIGGGAFQYCSSMTSIDIPNSVTEIGYYAFSQCSGLTSIEISNSVTYIGNGTFSNCSSLTSVTIPNSVTTIMLSSFKDCVSLISVTIPNSISISTWAFCNCPSLNTESRNAISAINPSALECDD